MTAAEPSTARKTAGTDLAARRGARCDLVVEAVWREGEEGLDFFGAAFLAAPIFLAVFAAMVGLLSTAAQAGRRGTRAAV
jgi:hypothetical protein